MKKVVILIDWFSVMVVVYFVIEVSVMIVRRIWVCCLFVFVVVFGSDCVLSVVLVLIDMCVCEVGEEIDV